ncbi:MAG: PAS domain-containing sensor histidine kinase [Syntrophobacterales bacterium]|jgi:two-component system phosphate regulon sensor histidine kinase PhoR|nr:PAS domain-containing sensor histidine kinase [Syntrophobacterales bacterium]
MSDTPPVSLSQSHDWSSFLIQKTPGAVITADHQGLITELNPAAERLTGYSRGEALGRPALEVLHLQGGDPSTWNLVLKGHKEATEEVTLRNRSGQEVPVMISSFALRDDNGTLRGGAIIIRDLTPVKRMETERRHLVNMFAHDLKTPVVGMAGLIRRMLQGKVGPLSDPQINYLQTVFREMDRLEKLITRFLEFARLDLRILTPQPQALDVAKECREVITLLQPLAEDKDITLETRLVPEMPPLTADPLLFRRVLENLLENAIKYSPAHSRVTLAAAAEDPAIRFTVQDQGPGIAPDDLAHLFEVFYRGAREGDNRGFGLGLATVKRIIDAHGGRIWVDTAPGRGCTFSFTFPLEPQNPLANSR